MPKERHYSVLKNQVFRHGSNTIVPIRYEDRIKIMQWRNEQIYHLRQAKLLTRQMQDDYFQNVVETLFTLEKPDQLLFSLLNDDTCIGYGGLVHINWIDKNAEISFIMDTSREEKHFEYNWKVFLALIEEVAFKELKLHKIFTYAFDLRPKLYDVLESCGFKEDARLQEHCLFDSGFLDVVIHSKLEPKITIRRANKGDIWTVFRWSNDSVARSNSFYIESICKEDHEKWFDKKLKSKESILLIGQIGNEPFGMVRYEIESTRAVVGVNIAKDFRGKGLATKILKLSLNEYHKVCDKPINAYIKTENLASKIVFERAGYQFFGTEEVNNFKSIVYRYEG